MARIELAREVFDDLECFFDHLAQFDGNDIPRHMEEIIQSLQLLEYSPLIGRKVKGGKRELVIGTGARGYLALYRFVSEIETVFVLAIRSQREPGYKRET